MKFKNFKSRLMEKRIKEVLEKLASSLLEDLGDEAINRLKEKGVVNKNGDFRFKNNPSK